MIFGKDNIERLEFLKSVGCFCVFGGTGCGCLPRYGLGRGGRRLRFGAMSDVHLWCESGWGDASIFEQTLRRMGEAVATEWTAGCDIDHLAKFSPEAGFRDRDGRTGMF